MLNPDVDVMLEDYASNTDGARSSNNNGSNIKISISDSSESGTDALDALKDIHRFLASNNGRKLSVFFSSTPYDINAHNPSPFLGLPTTPNAMIATPTGEECTGFPAGYFRIRAAGTNMYWSLHYGETRGDGNALTIWDRIDNDRSDQAFFIDAKGALCTHGLGIDVMGSTLILSHNRPPTVPWPNPWSHPSPTFAYSSTTKTISVKFHIDPVVSGQWPRPETEWKDPHKTFVVSARPPSEVRIYHLDHISKWAPDRRYIRWTSRAGDTWAANHIHALGVVEEKGVLGTGETDRVRWEIEQV